MKKGKPYKKPCTRCDIYFQPDTRHCRICNDCLKKNNKNKCKEVKK